MVGLVGRSIRVWFTALACCAVVVACGDDSSGNGNDIDDSGGSAGSVGDEGETGATDGNDPTPGDDTGGGLGDGGSADQGRAPSCASVDCKGGQCDESSGMPVCVCDPGFASTGLGCVPCAPAASTTAIDIPTERLALTVTFDGQDPPNSAYEDAVLVLRNPHSGDEVYLGATSEGELGAVVVPGVYHLHYAHAAGAKLPRNKDAYLETLDLRSSVDTTIDVETVTISGTVTLNGAAPPDTEYEVGRVYLVDELTGDEVPLTDTKNEDFTLRALPGHYAVYYSKIAGGLQVPANNRIKLGDTTIEPFTEVGQILTIDIPATQLEGSFLVDGGAPPSSQYEFAEIRLAAEGGDEIFVGRTLDQTYSLMVVPGEYAPVYTRVAGSSLPANRHAVLDAKVVPPAEKAERFSIDIPTALISGSISVDGGPPPQNPSDDGIVSLQNPATGDLAVLGNTHDGSYSQLVIPGTYDLFYSQETPSGGVPVNTNAELEAVVVSDTTTRNVDILTVLASGDIMLNGGVPPDSEYNDGRLYLREPQSTDSILLGSTRNGSFSALAVPGTYDIVYVAEHAGTQVPINSEAILGTADLDAQPSFSIDILTAMLAGDLTVGGGALPPADDDRGQLYIEDTTSDQVMFLGSTASTAVAQQLAAGEYLVYFRRELSGGTLPENTNAGMSCYVVAP